MIKEKESHLIKNFLRNSNRRITAVGKLYDYNLLKTNILEHIMFELEIKSQLRNISSSIMGWKVLFSTRK